MNTSTVTIKGTATIPKEIRDYLGISPGAKVNFTKAIDGTIKLSKVYSLEEVRKRNKEFIKRKHIPSHSELNNLIEKGMAEEAVRRYEQSQQS